MKIVVLESSPNRNGASNTLAGAFIRGAKETGHEVSVFDLAHMKFHLCTGCYQGHNRCQCILKDEFSQAETALENTDMIVYVTPVYYYLMASPLKAAVDRLHCFSPKLHGKKSLLLATAWRNDNRVMQYLKTWYEAVAEYLEYENQGAILAKGCGNVETVRNSPYFEEAYKVGKNLRGE